MTDYFAIRTQRHRRWYWVANDHVAALLEHAPDGPWAQIPGRLATILQHVADDRFAGNVFTLPQMAQVCICHELSPPPAPHTDQFFKDVYNIQVARYGPPIARDYRHVGRLIAEALRLGGWRVFVERGTVKFQRSDDTRIATPVPHTREPAPV